MTEEGQTHRLGSPSKKDKRYSLRSQELSCIIYTEINEYWTFALRRQRVIYDHEGACVYDTEEVI